MEVETLAVRFQALSHPERIRVLEAIILTDGQASVQQLADRLGMKQPTLSHHIRWLRDAGFVSCNRGHQRFYRVKSESLASLKHALEQFCTGVDGSMGAEV